MEQTLTKSEKVIALDGRTLKLEEVAAVARKSKKLEILVSEDSRQRIHASNALKEEIISKQQPIYGVTTGFGDSCKRQINPAKTLELQRNLVRYHVNGVGPLATDEVVRATMLIRANCLSRGNSGVRSDVISQLIEYIDRDIIPHIPERGSVGASGDLVPLCYLASTLIGEGKVNYKGQETDVMEALEAENLEPLILQAKEGLALINGTSFMSGFASLAVLDANELAFVADLCTAMASEALLGNRGHFYSFIHEQKPHPGQMASAELIYSLLEGSELSREYSQILETNEKLEDRTYIELTQSIQDRYSIRCAPHVTGVLYDTAEWARKWVEVEINSTNDNPLFDVESQDVYNGGNFYGGHICQAMDALKVAVANIADLLDRQMELVVDEKFNKNLTPNLIPFFAEDDFEAGLHHGFKGMQLACSAVTAEALKMTGPVSVFSRSTEAHNQDKVSMGTIAARDARTIVELVQNVAAIHLLALCQALDLRGADKMSPRTKAAYDLIRSQVPFVDRDRRMEGDIKQVVEMIRSGALREAVMSQLSM